MVTELQQSHCDTGCAAHWPGAGCDMCRPGCHCADSHNYDAFVARGDAAATATHKSHTSVLVLCSHFVSSMMPKWQ